MNTEKILNALKENRMNAIWLPQAAGVVEKIKELVPAGAAVAAGGSVSLQETGVTALLESGYYRFLNHRAPGLMPEESRRILLETFDADAYFCSANAITEAGELVNVDGNANRVAALCFGPKKVFVVAGINKIVPDIAAAFRRIKTVAAPENAKRLHCATYCAEKGVCMGLDGGLTAGCASPQRICADYVICGRQRVPDRITVLLVGEEIGY